MNQLPSDAFISRVLSALATICALVATLFVLFPDPLADAFVAGWMVLCIGLALLGGLGAWTNRTPLVWVAAILLLALSIIGMWSVGFLIAPAALFTLGAALFSHRTGPREHVQEAILAEPPTNRELVVNGVCGIGSVILGSGFVYVGSFTQELFGACAQETLVCSLEKTHWDAVGITLIGILAIWIGGWVVWKQLYILRVLRAGRPN